MPREQDRVVLSYTVQRINSALQHFVTERPEVFGWMSESIRARWEVVQEMLNTLIIRPILNREYEVDRAERAGLTDTMLDLKREAVDLASGRRSTPREWDAIFENARLRGETDQWERTVLSPENITLTRHEKHRTSPASMWDLALTVLGSVASVLKLAELWELLKEFLELSKASIEMAKEH